MRKQTLNGLGLAAFLVLAGCAEGGGMGGGNRTYYADLQGGAKDCTTTPARVSLSNGGATDVAMSVANDGGWCGISVSRFAGAYSAGLMVQRPARGKVYVHTVGSATRVDYTPDPGFSGSDTFAVKLIPGDATMRVAVTVKPGSSAAAASSSTSSSSSSTASKPAAKKKK
jgi:hypothetical protein